MPLYEGSESGGSGATLTNEASSQNAGGIPSDREASPGMAGAVALLEAKARCLEQCLVQSIRHGRTERRLLEDIIDIKEADLQYHRQRLLGAQKQAARLEKELIEYRCELLQCRRQLRQMFAEIIRLRVDKSKFQMLSTQLQTYKLKKVNDSWVQFADTSL